ncbi:hypothetical protein MNVM_29890 [Mycobacterium novum]|uniref:Uncharacterized protein n=1 Tax=Mycobacterium novum TaxID=2492438 RepID=A0A7I7JR77_9MYCO|nr:hypothetical protein MNVM_29890 [Mycobacterium novum]
MSPSAAAARGELARLRADELQRRRDELAAGLTVTAYHAGIARQRADASRARAGQAHRDAAARHLDAVSAHLRAASKASPAPSTIAFISPRPLGEPRVHKPYSRILRGCGGYSRFSGPTTAHTVLPPGVGLLPQARHRAPTTASPEVR